MIIIGHRGARGLAPENTLASFSKALEHGVAYVEFDARLTKDKQLVVIHDPDTKRIALQHTQISDITLAEIKALTTKAGESIPTLDEVLDHLQKQVKINIEIKTKGAAKYVIRTIWRLLEQGHTYDDILVSSFHASELIALHYFDEKLRLALLQRYFPFRYILLAKKLKLYGVGFKYIIALPWIIQGAKKRKLFTYVYTVNNTTSARLFKGWGVDAICTDRPDFFSTPAWINESTYSPTTGE